MRPILTIDIDKFTRLGKDNIIVDIISTFVFYIGFVINNMMLKGQIEQIQLILRAGEIKEDVLEIFEEVLFFIQLYFPSRFHNFYILSKDAKLVSIVQNSVFEYNKSSVQILNGSDDLLSKQIIKNLFREERSASCTFPPKLDNDITYDSDIEKEKYLLTRFEYINFISDQNNRSFYEHNQSLFPLEIESNKPKEFIISNFDTFNHKNDVEIKSDQIETEGENKEASDIHTKIKLIKKEYNLLKQNNGLKSQQGKKKTIVNKAKSTDSMFVVNPDTTVAEDIRKRIANKSFSVIDEESIDGLNYAEIKKRNDNIISKREPQHKRGFVIDCSGRNDSCCRMDENKCIIY